MDYISFISLTSYSFDDICHLFAQEAYDMSGARLALTLCVTKAREGSQADLDALESMFQQLRFESTMKKDPTAQVLCCQLQASRRGDWTGRWALGPHLSLAISLIPAIL